MSPRQPTALLVVGPTASGKSDLALALAARCGGVIINADAMQLYRELPILTAQPGAADRTAIPHALYGVRAAAEPASVAWWRMAALEAMEAAEAAGRVPILCGGTGLYLRALGSGIAPMPEIPPGIRASARALLAEIGPAALHARLAAADPATAARLRPSDAQRLARAWEVLEASGVGLAAWQERPPEGTRFRWRLRAVLLDPPRAALRAAIAARWQAMIEAGAVAEVAALLAQQLDPALPAMRAHGVPELAQHMAGLHSLEEASRRAILHIGQYTKRQATWFRHQRLVEDGHTLKIVARCGRYTQLSECWWSKFMMFLSDPR